MYMYVYVYIYIYIYILCIYIYIHTYVTYIVTCAYSILITSHSRTTCLYVWCIASKLCKTQGNLAARENCANSDVPGLASKHLRPVFSARNFHLFGAAPGQILTSKRQNYLKSRDTQRTSPWKLLKRKIMVDNYLGWTMGL